MIYSLFGRRTASGLHRIYRSILRSFRHEFTGEELLHLRTATALVSEGSCALDIGAHAGAWTIALSRLVGPAGLVAAFEPVPGNFQVLIRRTADLSNVRCFDAALSSSSGTSVILVPGDTCEPSTGAIVGTADQLRYPEGMERLTISIEKFDNLSADLLGDRRLSFIKCDVEGHELAVLEGAVGIIEEYRPVVMLEILREKWPDGDPTSSASALFLSDRGYRMAQLTEAGPLLDGNGFSPRMENFIFLPDDESVEKVFASFRSDPGKDR